MPATLMSIAEFELLPDVPGKQELLEGELISFPPAKCTHNKVAEALFRLLMPVCDASCLHVEAGYQMSPDTWLQPDVSVEWPDQREANDYLQGSPMLAIEVVSPGNRAEEIDRKISNYLKHGAEEVWIVNPRTRWMMVHRGASVERVTDTYRCTVIPVTIILNDILPGE
jgi:Uma2 family endonuclease